MTRYTDLYLRAADESELIAVLPGLRESTGEVSAWWFNGPHHTLSTEIVILTALPSAPDMRPRAKTRGLSETPAETAEGFHLNLRLATDHPQYPEILAAAAPFRVAPATPRSVFA